MNSNGETARDGLDIIRLAGTLALPLIMRWAGGAARGGRAYPRAAGWQITEDERNRVRRYVKNPS